MHNLNKETLKIYFKALMKYKWRVIFGSIILTLAIFVTLLWPLIFAKFFEIIADTQNGDRSLAVGSLVQVLIWLMVVDFFHHLGWWSFKSIELRTTTSTVRDLGNFAFSTLQKHSSRFFANNFSGALVKRVNRFTSSFQTISDIVFYDMAKLAIKLVIVTGYMMYVNWIFGFVIIVWATLFMFFNFKMAKYKLKFDIAKAKSDTKVTAELSDSITNDATSKLFAGCEYEMNRFAKATENRREKTKKSWFIGINIETVQGLSMSVLEIFILFIAMKLWALDLIGIGVLFIIQSYLMEIFHSIWNFGNRVRKIYEALADANEMTEIIQTKFEIVDKKNAKDLVVKSAKVEIKNVSFKYDNDSNYIFEKLNLRIKPQEKVAFVGPSGGGKTTLTKLILRLYDIQKGEILIDGQDISKVRQESLRSSIALVPQEPILFHRSLMENIRYGRRDASDEEVIIASKMARCHDFIMSFKDKYKTFVGERGVKLSGGQRQRVAIARAILSNAKILIFDEATSSLDSESETLINEAIENLTKNKTTIIIAHRLSTIMKSDRVFVIEGGAIVEEGQHAELIAKNSGIYQKLWTLQSGGYL